MENYKPYPFLYKNQPAAGKITVEFYINLPTSERLTGPVVTTVAATNTTTLTYAVAGGSTPSSPVLFSKVIDWNGNRATVNIVVETAGGQGGYANVNSTDFE